MQYLFYALVCLFFWSCNSNISRMKGCVDCLNKLNDSSKYMDLLFSIGFDGRPTCLNTDYETLEKRIGIDINTNFKVLSMKDSFLSKIDTERFFICYKEKREYQGSVFFTSPVVIMDSIEHLTIINKDAVKLLQYISVNPIDSSEAERILKKFGFEILKAKQIITPYWFSGHENYVLFNCFEGDKRLIYCRDTLPKYRFEENHLFKLKENWYLYDDPRVKSKRYKRIIKKKQKKYNWI